jgi:hypothetical protein
MPYLGTNILNPQPRLIALQSKTSNIPKDVPAMQLIGEYTIHPATPTTPCPRVGHSQGAHSDSQPPMQRSRKGGFLSVGEGISCSSVTRGAEGLVVIGVKALGCAERTGTEIVAGMGEVSAVDSMGGLDMLLSFFRLLAFG